jgi:16S rRNA processing protein RimM
MLREVELRKEGHAPVRLALEAHWFHKNRIILKFQGIDSISQAGLLRGYELTLPSTERFPLPEGCYYHFDLVGCFARDLQGQALGEVLEVMNLGGNLLLKISNQQGEFLVPFARDILKDINLESKELVCDLPEGLMDL